MRAVFFPQPSKAVLIDDAVKPQPKDGEVLVQCSHIALCGTNMGPYLGDGRWGEIDWPPPAGWLGHENIGRIVQSRAEGWEEGTLVLAHPDAYNGFVEFIISNPLGLARLPQDIADPGDLVVAQPLATVLRGMRHVDPVVQERVAVVGQGPMGLIFTQLLGRMGAKQIIAIDKVPWRLEWAKRFGATHVVDASKDDPIEAVKQLTDGEMVDFCVEAVGHSGSLMTAAYLPRRLGRLFVFGVPHHEKEEFPWFHTMTNETQIITSMGPECMEYFQTAVDMVVQGRSDLVSMVTPRLPWEKAPEAFEMYANPAEHEGSLKVTLVL